VTPLDRSAQRDLEILAAVSEDTFLTQRSLSGRLGVALGLTNLYLRRLATKGYIKVIEFPAKPRARKRLRYLLTGKGIAEKTRLTYEYMGRSVTLYRHARETLREALRPLRREGLTRIALYGTGEAAELAYLTLRELGLEPVGVFDRTAGGVFLGMSVRDYRELSGEELDRIVLATFDRPKLHVPGLLALGIPADKLVTLYPARRANGSR